MRSTLGLALALCISGCTCDSVGGGDAGSIASDGGPSTVTDSGTRVIDAGPTLYTDFSSTPVIGAGLPSDVANAFAGTDQTGAGPCLSEPTLGALIPSNWTPLYLEWTAVGTATTFQVRLHVANQANDYVAYTTDSSLELPSSVWKALAQHSAGSKITLTLRAVQLQGSTAAAGPFLGVSGDVEIAPVAASGTIVYWTTSNNTALKGFAIGDATAKVVLSPANDGLPGSHHTCVGCHTSSPDGKLAFFAGNGNMTGSFGVDAWTIDGTVMRASTSQMTAHAFSLLNRSDQTFPTLSAAHYSAADAIVITAFNGGDTNGRTELVWTDLHAAADGTGTLARTGDSKQAALPNFSHDGQSIVYVSSDQVVDGRTGDQPTDLRIVPYNTHQGGASTLVAGASTAEYNETYPAFSPDDSLIAFNRMALGNTYDEPSGEVYLVPAAGGTATRVTANDPPACTSKHSPGLTNAWPRWSPQVSSVGSKKYYWLTFSSRRGAAGKPQLYVAAVVVDSGVVTTYPALYVRSQIAGEDNHTPAWDVFEIMIN